jgi:predicted RNA binding protein YcfA (HicA-like mRNA interferase family)
MHLHISNIFITFAYVKCSELFKLLKNNGWYEIRQSGSHVIIKHPEKNGTLSVPFHSSKEVKKGLLRAILKQSNIKTDKR